MSMAMAVKVLTRERHVGAAVDGGLGGESDVGDVGGEFDDRGSQRRTTFLTAETSS